MYVSISTWLQAIRDSWSDTEPLFSNPSVNKTIRVAFCWSAKLLASWILSAIFVKLLLSDSMNSGTSFVPKDKGTCVWNLSSKEYSPTAWCSLFSASAWTRNSVDCCSVPLVEADWSTTNNICSYFIGNNSVGIAIAMISKLTAITRIININLCSRL